MNPERFQTIDDLRRHAARRIPKFAFDYLEGGAGTEAGIARNRAAFENVLLNQFFLRDVRTRSIAVDLFGQTYDSPIGISPLGLCDLVWPGADKALARAAHKLNLPFILSAAATTEMENVAVLAPDHLWFQLYVSTREDVTFDLIARAAAARIKVLVVTVDLPVPAKRLRDLRNGFSLPFRMTPKMIWELATRPAWSLVTVKAGTPRFRNMEKYMPPASDNQSLAAFMAQQITAGLDEDLFARIRDAWPGKLVIKGVMTPETALLGLKHGADGVIVSNHGGRQIDSAPATLDVLPEIAAAVAGKVPVMLDSGIRNGIDVIKAFALGADYVFSGRSFAYGFAAAGFSGIERAAALIGDEAHRGLAQVGVTGLKDLSSAAIWSEPAKRQTDK